MGMFYGGNGLKNKLGIIVSLVASILMLAGCSLPGITLEPTSTPPATSAVASPSSSLSGSTASPSASPKPTSPTVSPSPVSSALLAMEALLENIYSQVNPSVVNIQVLEKAQTTFPGLPGPQATPGAPQFSSALGSGFVWDSQGHIVTNNHVVSAAQNISVIFSDGTMVPASVVGTDPDSDLAVIKVDVPAQQLNPVKMADSTQLKVGQIAIAIGNPFGLQGTMTVGFISGLGRLLPTNINTMGPAYSIPNIIQTDASINPGNSGGVLLDDEGKVIGVTSAIATQSGSSAGVGFAIPSAIVQKVAPSLIQNGHYDHPWLGVSVVTLTPDLNKAMNLKSDQRGAMVQQIMANSPAGKAGLQASQRQVTINSVQIAVGGDIITAFDGRAVKRSDDLVTFLSESGSIGQTVTLTILRNGQEMQIQVTLAARPAS